MDNTCIGGVEFPQNIYERNLNVFREGLAHSSLSCEKVFEELSDIEEKVKKLREKESLKKYSSLPIEEKEEITRLIRYFVIYSAMYARVIPGNIKENETDKITQAYYEFFPYFDEWIYEVLVFEQNGFEMKKTYQKIVELFRVLPKYKLIKEKANQMKLDHIAAFDYAMKKESIGIPEIIQINTIVNASQPEKEEGFKKVNNIIEGAGFTPIPKEAVPGEISKLLYEYKNNFGGGVISSNLKNETNYKTKREMMLEIMKKEAKFHIRFERIHPFIDGNGRTGRILLNRNLLRQGLAPVIITDVSMEKYKKFISDNNDEEFAMWLLENSNQTLTLWEAELHSFENLNVRNSSLIFLEENRNTNL